MYAKSMRVIRWLAASVIAVFVLLVASWNLTPDEALSPEIENLIALAPPPPAEGNAFFMIWGFEASPELDPVAVGAQIVATHDRLLAAEKRLDKFKIDDFMGLNRPKMPKVNVRHCFLRIQFAPEEQCLNSYERKSEEIAKEAEERKVYLERYRKLRQYKDFGNAISQASSESPVPTWGLLLRMSDLVDASIVYRMSVQATQREALQELSEEVESWRRYLGGNDWLMTQMVADATLMRKYRLAGELMIRYPEVVSSHRDLVRRITAPLTIDQANTAQSIKAEARATIGELDQISRTGTLSSHSFFYEGLPDAPLRLALAVGGYKPTSTLNRILRGFKPIVDRAALTPKQMIESRAQLDADFERATKLDLGALSYNLAGRALVAGLYSNYVDYAYRLADLVAFSRIIELQRQMIEAGVPKDQIGNFIAKSQPNVFDPYTEQPMKWDASMSRISYSPHSSKHIAHSYVTLGTAKNSN